MKTLFSISFLILGSTFASASSFESISVQSRSAFNQLAARQSTTRWVRVSGNLKLDGYESVPKGSNYISVRLSGDGSFQDQTGKIRSSSYNSVQMTANVYISPYGWVSETVRPSIRVSFYENGRFVGSTQMDGAITVSGRAMNDTITVSGSGELSGTLYLSN